jgi:hypothetical protein
MSLAASMESNPPEMSATALGVADILILHNGKGARI